MKDIKKTALGSVTASPSTVIFGGHGTQVPIIIENTEEWRAIERSHSAAGAGIERLADSVILANTLGQTRAQLEALTGSAIERMSEELRALFGHAFIGVEADCRADSSVSRTVMVATVRVREAADADWWAANYDRFSDAVFEARCVAGAENLQVDIQFDQ